MTDTLLFLRPRWRAITLIAATYFYFLIYAQFGFLHRITETLGEEQWDVVLGVMAVSGVCGALWTASNFESLQGRRWLFVGFLGSWLATGIALLGTDLPMFVLSAGLTGFFLALLTTALVGVLSESFPGNGIGLVCGLGTGSAYFFSNVPAVFSASALMQCALGGGACMAGIAVCCVGPLNSRDGMEKTANAQSNQQSLSRARWVWLGVVLIFFVLVWTDSAAFTRIQETPKLKALTWSGASHLWMIGGMHFVAAFVGGWLMDRGRLALLAVLSFLGLLIGFATLQQSWGGFAPTLLYVAGVSLYSTALVAFALVKASVYAAVLRAGVVFAVAGWIGSAMGIGMANDLGRVPVAFWCVATCVLLLGIFLERRGEAV
jgi:cytochrome c oxidase cbb3-type subunit 2